MFSQICDGSVSSRNTSHGASCRNPYNVIFLSGEACRHAVCQYPYPGSTRACIVTPLAGTGIAQTVLLWSCTFLSGLNSESRELPMGDTVTQTTAPTAAYAPAQAAYQPAQQPTPAQQPAPAQHQQHHQQPMVPQAAHAQPAVSTCMPSLRRCLHVA